MTASTGPRVVLMPVNPDDLVTANQAAAIARVHPDTIRTWKSRGKLEVKGLDENGLHMFRVGDVIRVEAKTRRRQLNSTRSTCQ